LLREGLLGATSATMFLTGILLPSLGGDLSNDVLQFGQSPGIRWRVVTDRRRYE
jgi:hypothetical protein